MILLLPPSETKRDGGEVGTSLDLTALGFPELTTKRRATLAALRVLSRNLKASTAGLGLGATQRFEIDRNRVVMSAPVLPAIDRYTGVLYDALDAPSLSTQEREFANATVVIHSALFGLVRALDPIPAYRLSHDSRLPKVRLRQHWSAPISAVLARYPGLILDLRSEGYAALGPRPERENCAFVRVIADDGAGRRRALNHFNKKAKGEFARAVIQAQIAHESVDAVCSWADGVGVRLEPGRQGEIDLVV